MKVQLNSGIEYDVTWNHKNRQGVSTNKLDVYNSNNIDNRSYTQCNIDSVNFKGIGKATVGINQNYCKDYGRKISLKRAMQNIGFTKQTRTLFWHQYHKMTNKPQRIK